MNDGLKVNVKFVAEKLIIPHTLGIKHTIVFSPLLHQFCMASTFNYFAMIHYVNSINRLAYSDPV